MLHQNWSDRPNHHTGAHFTADTITLYFGELHPVNILHRTSWPTTAQCPHKAEERKTWISPRRIRGFVWIRSLSPDGTCESMYCCTKLNQKCGGWYLNGTKQSVHLWLRHVGYIKTWTDRKERSIYCRFFMADMNLCSHFILNIMYTWHVWRRHDDEWWK